MAQLVTEAERAAQRRFVGVVRTSGVLTGGGLALRREYNAGEWQASAAELTQDLDTLKVPHERSAARVRRSGVVLLLVAEAARSPGAGPGLRTSKGPAGESVVRSCGAR